jgi:hypothetical protein
MVEAALRRPPYAVRPAGSITNEIDGGKPALLNCAPAGNDSCQCGLGHSIRTFTPEEHVYPAIAEPNACVRELTYTLTKRGQRIFATAVVVHRAAQRNAAARPSRAYAIAAHQIAHYFSLLTGFTTYGMTRPVLRLGG